MTTKTLDKSKTVHHVYDFFKQFAVWIGKSPSTPSLSELEQYLSKNVKLHNNGELVAKSSAEYLERLKKFQKKYSHFQISQPLEEPLISENQAAIYYKLDLTTHDGQHKQIFIAGFVTLEDDKISKWTEVSHEKSTQQWDK